MKPINRRTLFKTLALGGAGVALNRNLPALAQAVKNQPVKIAALEMLDQEFGSQPFVFADKKCLLVRLPPQKEEKKNPRLLEISHKTKDGASEIITLTAFTRICTHLGCTPGGLDNDHHMNCPCHGSVFAADGSVVQGPAARALQAVKLQVKDGEVFAVALIDDK